MTTHELEFQQSKPIEIEGQRGINLKQLFIEDAQAYFDLIEYNRAHLSQFNDPTAEKYPDANAVIGSIVNPENPDRLRFGVWDGNTMVGSINLTPTKNSSAEIGYWVGGQFTRRGYASQAVKELNHYAFEELGYDTLTAAVFFGNVASERTLMKNGYRRANIYWDIKDGRKRWLWKYELNKPELNRLTP